MKTTRNSRNTMKHNKNCLKDCKKSQNRALLERGQTAFLVSSVSSVRSPAKLFRDSQHQPGKIPKTVVFHVLDGS